MMTWVVSGPAIFNVGCVSADVALPAKILLLTIVAGVASDVKLVYKGWLVHIYSCGSVSINGTL